MLLLTSRYAQAASVELGTLGDSMLKRPHGGTRGVVSDAKEQSLSLDIRRRHALRRRDQPRRRASALHSRMVRWVVSTTAAVLVFGPSPTLARAQSCPGVPPCCPLPRDGNSPDSRFNALGLRISKVLFI